VKTPVEFGHKVFPAESAKGRCRQECGWNCVTYLRLVEVISSGGEVNWLIDRLSGESLPAIDLAHVDLS
jgi:hypothetical protein